MLLDIYAVTVIIALGSVGAMFLRSRQFAKEVEEAVPGSLVEIDLLPLAVLCGISFVPVVNLFSAYVIFKEGSQLSKEAQRIREGNLDHLFDREER